MTGDGAEMDGELYILDALYSFVVVCDVSVSKLLGFGKTFLFLFFFGIKKIV